MKRFKLLMKTLIALIISIESQATLTHEDIERYEINEHQVKVGDMIIDKEDIRLGEKGMTARLISIPWTGGILPIVFAPQITQEEKEKFYNACSEWEQVSSIKCIDGLGYAKYIYVQTNRAGCYSEVGQGLWRFFNKRRTINLSRSGCWQKRTIMHEIGHALGLLHEHQRSDRSRYVKIKYRNIKLRNIFNFQCVFWSSNWTPYDFLSIMHYRKNAFAKNTNLITIEPRPQYKHYENIMGRNASLSFGDVVSIQAIYGP